MRYTVAVDFDGVLHSYSSPWVNEEIIPDPPVEGAIEWLVEIMQEFDVVIHTTRGSTPEGQIAVRDWLYNWGLPSDFCQDLKVTNIKPAALVYLDDRALRFEGPGTFPDVQDIHNARPWNKK